MSASLFPTLPPELICRVFEFADDFSVVAALAQTARIFYLTWREHPTSICQAVAPRVFSNLTDAERLLDMQEAAEAVTQSQVGRKEKSIIRAKRLLSNARCASAAADHWVDICEIHKYFDREDPRMRPSELARFEHAFYSVWTIGIMGTVPYLHDQASAFLDECSPRELCRLNELAQWAIYFNENEFGSSGLDFHDEIWKIGCDLASSRWMKVAYHDGRHAIAPPDGTPLKFFAFFDDTQKYLELISDE
ncbi:hypothetical protein CC80DRAFT_493109 [Byssothecium circinans]|uniref:F-box domain-containing protein n=1 Tax=Byssothecium circinans TaxID=147558 RepID=A0A6A5TR41_9PLEO|nr:hypothetical protein CC80DRAFT_493109 [Byssothecium circinans]